MSGTHPVSLQNNLVAPRLLSRQEIDQRLLANLGKLLSDESLETGWLAALN